MPNAGKFCDFPDHLQVLRCFLRQLELLLDHKSKAKWEAAGRVTEQIVDIYKRANIPTLEQRKLKQKIINYHENTYRALYKIPNEKRSCDPAKTRIASFQNEKRIDYFESMKTDRAASMGQVDKVFKKTPEKRQKRTSALEKQKEKELTRRKDFDNSVVSWPSDCDYDDDGNISATDDEDFDYVEPNQKRSHHRVVKTGTTVFIPHDVLRKQCLISSNVRNGITPAVAATSLQALIEACDGESSQVNLSYSSAAR